MSGLARFSVTDFPLGTGVPPARQFRLTCPHGETAVTHMFGPPPDSEDVLALLRARHEDAERCGCAASVTRDEARA
jgi:hypothetical protein